MHLTKPKFITALVAVFMICGLSHAQNVLIPDANFKAYLVGNTSINTNGDTEIQVAEASAFTGVISCQGLSISDLTGIEAFIAITELRCQSNALTSLDVSANTALELLFCGANQLTSLDVSQNTSLNNLLCQINQLSYLNVANGNNISMGQNSFSAHTNPNLTCITVDDVTYSTSTWTNIDPQTSFSTNCPCVVTIPDANFKAILVGMPGINTNGDNEIQCSEASAYTGGIVCDYEGITSLVGIEAFTNLTSLEVPYNQLTSLDLSQNTALIHLDCGENLLTSLDVSNNVNLTSLKCWLNQLTSLDLSQNSNLTHLECNNNQLTALDLSSNPLLVNIQCGYNLLASIDVSNQADLNTLSCHRNAIAALDVSQNPDLVILDCDSNQITVLDLTQNTMLTHLSCSYNQLSSIGVSHITGLYQLSCGFNQLTSLDVSQNSSLHDLFCSNNQITSLDITQNPSLFSVSCNNNQLTELDLTQNTNLYVAICDSNQITSLDLTQNSALGLVGCTSNQLYCLNVQNGANSSIFSFWATGNPNLNCIQVDDVAWSSANWTNIDAQTSFSTDCGNPCFIGITELPENEKTVIKIVDLMGRVTSPRANTPLIYIYSDGTTERVYNLQK